jgi:pimeloyl-ACP methyl ester carboxylesterase
MAGMGRLSRFARGGLTFDVADGGPEPGDPVVLLHGFPQDGSCWDGVLPALHEAGLRTLVPDQRGYSPGARPRGAAAYRMDELTADVLGLLDTAGLRRAHVVGHDWGGTVGWALAGRYPERVHTLTVLSTPHPEAFARAVRTGTQGLRSAYMLAMQLPELPELVLGRVLGPMLARSGMPAPEVARAVARMRERRALSAALGWYRALRLDLGARYPTVRVPTTFVWGRHDPALGRVAAELTRSNVSAPYRFVELDAGHWLPETRPVQVTSVLLDRIRTVAQT